MDVTSFGSAVRCRPFAKGRSSEIKRTDVHARIAVRNRIVLRSLPSLRIDDRIPLRYYRSEIDPVLIDMDFMTYLIYERKGKSLNMVGLQFRGRDEYECDLVLLF